MDIKWKCTKCNWQGEEPSIIPGMCGGEVVDILDVFCTSCVEDVKFQGSDKEESNWWDAWENKIEGKVNKQD